MTDNTSRLHNLVLRRDLEQANDQEGLGSKMGDGPTPASPHVTDRLTNFACICSTAPSTAYASRAVRTRERRLLAAQVVWQCGP